MDLLTFQGQADELIAQIEALIDEMPYKGDKEADSQKICLQRCLDELQYAINGCEQEDFED
mgnify:CR=1 FL=1